MMTQPWMRWAAAEGLIKTGSSLVSKAVGISASSFFGAVFSTLLIGVVQGCSGFSIAKARGASLKISKAQLGLCLAFGLGASLATWMGIFAFTYPGAEVGVVVFLNSLSIVPGSVLGLILFGERLKIRQMLGIGVFIAAGYAMLNFPSLKALLDLPPWFFLALTVPLFNASNEAVTQAQTRTKTKPLDPWVNNFWIGTATVVFSTTVLMLVGNFDRISSLPGQFWLGSMINGLFVVVMIWCKLLSYQRGGTIALKKLIMSGTFLTTTVIMGFVVYQEPLTWGKILGIGGFLVAFALTDNKTWQELRAKFLV